MSRSAAVVWLNGELVPEQDATVPFLTAGIHYGVGVFEGIRAYATDDGAAIFRVRDHVEQADPIGMLAIGPMPQRRKRRTTPTRSSTRSRQRSQPTSSTPATSDRSCTWPTAAGI